MWAFVNLDLLPKLWSCTSSNVSILQMLQHLESDPHLLPKLLSCLVFLLQARLCLSHYRLLHIIMIYGIAKRNPPVTSCTLPRTCWMWAASPSPPATPSSAAGPGWTGRTCPRCSRCPEKLFHEIQGVQIPKKWFTKLIQNLQDTKSSKLRHLKLFAVHVLKAAEGGRIVRLASACNRIFWLLQMLMVFIQHFAFGFFEKVWWKVEKSQTTSWARAPVHCCSFKVCNFSLTLRKTKAPKT